MELGLTLQKAADRAGFSGRQRWSGIEQGERTNLSVATIAAVAKALGCSIEALLMPARGSMTKRKAADTQPDRASKK